MPFLWFGKKTKVRPKPDGRKEERFCPECKRNAIFHEAEAESTYHAYAVLDLFTTNDEVFICGECSEWMALDATEPKRLSERERAKLLAATEKQALEDAKAREREKREHEKSIDRELAEIKKRLGRE